MRQPATNASVRNEPDCEERQRLGAVGLLDRHRGDEHDDRQRDEDEADRAELPLQVGDGAFLDRLGDLDHLGRALVGGEHALHEDEPDGEGEQRGERRADEDEPFTPSEGEFLVAAFGGEELASLRLPLVELVTRLTRMWWRRPVRRPASAFRLVATAAAVGAQGAGHVDLAGDPLAERAGLAVDLDDQRPVERVLLDDGDLDARHDAEGARGTTRSRRRSSRTPPPRRRRRGSRSYSSGVLGTSCASARGIGKPCGQVVGPVQRHVEALGDLVGQVVLERHGQLVGLVPGVAEHVGEEALDDAVAPDGGHRGLPAVVGERDALVGAVVDQTRGRPAA